jgi:hypothetical protein
MVVFCSGCGNNVSVGERFCAVCGQEVSAASAPAPAFGPPAEGTIFPAQTSGKAIASLVCGLFLFAFPLSILAVIFGHLSVSEIRKSSGCLKGEGIAIAGLVLGHVGLAVIPVILIVAAIAIPNLLRARMAANESSAVASVRTAGAAEVQYFSSHPEAGFTCRLSDLAASGLIDSRLATGRRTDTPLNCEVAAPPTRRRRRTSEWSPIPWSANKPGLALFVRTNRMVGRLIARVPLKIA